jgi:hypothetical protein
VVVIEDLIHQPNQEDSKSKVTNTLKSRLLVAMVVVVGQQHMCMAKFVTLVECCMDFQSLMKT